jgi:proline iminopeptidase
MDETSCSLVNRQPRFRYTSSRGRSRAEYAESYPVKVDPAGSGRLWGRMFFLARLRGISDMSIVELHAESVGSGTPILTIHGGLGIDHRYFRPWLDPLADHATLIFADLRGHGATRRDETLENATHEHFCADIDALRARLGKERVVVFGHSYGGFLALEYALRYPAHVAGLILCATSASLAHAPIAIDNARARGLPDALAALQRALSAPLASNEELAELWAALTPMYFADATSSRIREAFSRTSYSAKGYNRAAFECLPSYDVRKRLSDIHAPTLVVSGEHDWLMPPSLAGNELAASIPRARHAVFNESGHYPFIEEPQRFVNTVREWMTEVQ